MKLRTKFQDEDFKLGELVEVDIATMPDGRIKLQGEAKAGGLHTIFYESLEKLYNDWEDATEEQPKGIVEVVDRIVPTMVYIEYSTAEEAKKAVEKLKAWTRLEDKGFKFKYWTYKMDEPKIENHTHFMIVGVCEDGARFDDLDLLFGGEE